jgi:2-keto-4-pentenoate hydratase
VTLLHLPVAPMLALLLTGAAFAASPDHDYMAQLMVEAANARAPYPDLVRINPALTADDLYAVQQRFVAAQVAAGARIAGFKGGLVPQAPIGGVLFADGLREAPQSVSRKLYHSLLVEAEIAFEFCTAVTAPLIDVAAVKAAVCRLRPAVELPDAAIPDLGAIKSDLPRLAQALIPTNIATRDVALGAPRDAAAHPLSALHIVTMRNGETLGERTAGDANDAMWESVRWIVNEFVLKHGYRLEAGHIVMPGNLTGLHPGSPGHYRVDYGALGVVEFDVVD